MNKMTDEHIADGGKKVEEVIKALEFCSHCVCDDDKTETKCPYYNMPFCKNYLRKQSLDLINRQQAEIERLKKGWKADVIETQNIKAEAIKEFETKIHEKLHQAEMHGNFEPVVTREIFDSVVKEMVGEGK